MLRSILLALVVLAIAALLLFDAFARPGGHADAARPQEAYDREFKAYYATCIARSQLLEGPYAVKSEVMRHPRGGFVMSGVFHASLLDPFDITDPSLMTFASIADACREMAVRELDPVGTASWVVKGQMRRTFFTWIAIFLIVLTAVAVFAMRLGREEPAHKPAQT